MSEFDYLPPLGRVQRFRARAQGARQEAARAKGTLQESHLLTAERWDRLADMLEGYIAQSESKPKPKNQNGR
jgi:hypothetical protein